MDFDALKNLPGEKLLDITPIYIDIGRKKLGIAVIGPVCDGYVLKDSFENTIRSGKAAKIAYMIGGTKNDIAMVDDIERSPMYQSHKNFAYEMNRKGNPTYMYMFNRIMPGDDSGAFHACDLWYVFGTTNRCWRPLGEEDTDLANDVMDNWASFFKTGKPKDEKWLPLTEGDTNIHKFEI